MNHDERTDEVYQGIQEAFYFSTGAGVTRSSHGVYHTIFDRNVSQSDQGRGRVFRISEIWTAADRYGNFVTDVWYRSRKCLCNGILWICEKCTKRSVCKNTGIFI